MDCFYLDIFICMLPFFLLKVNSRFYNDSYYILGKSIFSLLLYLVTIGLEYIFKEERPYPECIPFFYSEYGLPCRGIVFVTNVASSMLIYILFFRKNNDVYDKKWKYIYRFMWKCILIVTLLFLIFAYPLIVYLFYLCSIKQLITSLIFSLLTTGIFHFIIKKIIYKKISNQEIRKTENVKKILFISTSCDKNT